MDVLGIGILIKGKSGIGKSEVALDLLERKHRLVADDLVVAHRRSEFLIGYSLDSPYSHYIEARGIGLIDIRSLFGIQSIRHKKRIEILIELIKGDDIDYKEFDRIRVKSLYEKILGIKIPKYIIPVTYSKNLANLIEVIALAHIANIMGESPINSINESIAKSPKSKVNTSYIDTFYFISDNE
jgi:HPr kinase/phosphorylase